MGRALVIVVIGSLAASAHADPLPTIDAAFPATLRFGAPGVSIKRVAIAFQSAPAVTWISVELASHHRGRVELPIDLPAGTRVVGMALQHEGATHWGAALPWRVALASYRTGSDPALLSATGTSAGEDHATLQVEAPATIELAVELPRLPALAVDPGSNAIDQVEIEVDGEHRASLRTPRHAELVDLGALAVPEGDDAYPHLDATTWLVADGSAPLPTIEMGTSQRVFTGWTPDKQTIRRVVKQHVAQLRRCYMLAAQGDPTIEGGVVAHFLIEANGSVPSSEVDGDLPANVRSCLAEQVGSWRFPEGDGRVMVNYPIAFRVHR